ncbi:hypothetical protein FB472_1673 [Rhodoglobus vestalii]|uniref:DUF1989 domain-containing protein n=1 Tax=Rhodoglobus vestalii TaxID=193384 RepID=A0A8H2PYT8_9MICO|nr:urea carboxylase-associated family protein [Rhodoglobus vestalii]TQO20063.1 hypothetical protein FB472_1673 [Rhodoglobus vestalii]
MTLEKVRIPAATAYAGEVRKGSRCRITDISGTQVADAMFFRLDNPLQKFSQNITRIMNWTSEIKVGSTLYSDLQRPLAVVPLDTVGRHDTFFCSCSRYVYEEIYKVGPRLGCRENIHEALQGWTKRSERAAHIPEELLSDPLNCFQNSGFKTDGTPYLNEAWSAKGDHSEFEALEDLVVAVSACPDDISDCNGQVCSDIELDFYVEEM